MIDSVRELGGRPDGPQAPAVTRWSRLARSPVRAAITGLLGGAAAAAYAHFVGCRTGTCPLTSNVWIAGTYGTIVGAIVGWPTRER